MELKDVILSTLAEMEDNEVPIKRVDVPTKPKKIVKKHKVNQKSNYVIKEAKTKSSDEELIFLNSLKERLLVLFEGFQAPNNSNVEAKVDMTLNFLEYALATIDERATEIEKGTAK